MLLICNNNDQIVSKINEEMKCLFKRHTQHIIYGYLALDMVKDYLGSKRGNSIAAITWATLLDKQKRFLYIQKPTDRIEK